MEKITARASYFGEKSPLSRNPNAREASWDSHSAIARWIDFLTTSFSICPDTCTCPLFPRASTQEVISIEEPINNTSATEMRKKWVVYVELKDTSSWESWRRIVFEEGPSQYLSLISDGRLQSSRAGVGSLWMENRSLPLFAFAPQNHDVADFLLTFSCHEEEFDNLRNNSSSSTRSILLVLTL
jgi:hypothetical protein